MSFRGKQTKTKTVYVVDVCAELTMIDMDDTDQPDWIIYLI